MLASKFNFLAVRDLQTEAERKAKTKTVKDGIVQIAYFEKERLQADG